ncbi:MAG: polysaccharide deacetylase family protein [Deltaproteobacteria bacterium]|nr:polysaccharide deacetylase family protein [Deltaproteobacteria bacterium]
MTPRWFLKRALKWGVEWTTEFTGGGLIYRNSNYFKTGYRILTYHRIEPNPTDSHSLKIQHFRDHIAFLKDHHPVVSLSEMVLGIQGKRKIEAGSVSITFDDGYAEAAGVVAEILDKFDMTASFFVITGILDGKQGGYQGVNYLSWEKIRQLKKGGFLIGSHTITHRSLGALTLPNVQLELGESFDRLETELGVPPDGLSFPFGTYRDFSQDVISVARSCKYPYAVTAIHGLNHTGNDLFRLQRTTITAGDGLNTFKRIMKGALDPWRFVDEWGYRLQRPSSSLE